MTLVYRMHETLAASLPSSGKTNVYTKESFSGLELKGVGSSPIPRKRDIRRAAISPNLNGSPLFTSRLSTTCDGFLPGDTTTPTRELG